MRLSRQAVEFNFGGIMNTEEKRVMHGLYYGCGKNLNDSIKYRSEEIIWLINTKIPKTAEWRQSNGGFKMMESDSTGNFLTDISKGKRRAAVPLSYLKEAGFITCENSDGLFHISVTAKGAEIARELDTRLGRINLLYRKHKDGILGILLTILVSIVTTIATNYFVASPTEQKTVAKAVSAQQDAR
jgi:hypothetical protein